MSSWLKFGIVAGLFAPYVTFVMADNRTGSRVEAVKLMLVWFRNAVGIVAAVVVVFIIGALLNPVTH